MGQGMAPAMVASEKAEALQANGHLKIGWVNWRIRPRLVVPRLGFGHIAPSVLGQIEVGSATSAAASTIGWVHVVHNNRDRTT